MKLEMILLIIVVYLFMLWIFPAHGSYTLEKNGACPIGWYTSGSYCVPGKNAPYAVHKTGTCPSGWSTSGKYCIKRGK